MRDRCLRGVHTGREALADLAGLADRGAS